MKKFQQVLFLCTGNYYRGPHAESVFNHLAKSQEISWRAISLGFQPKFSAGFPSRFVKERLASLGITVDQAEPAPHCVSVNLLAESSLVVAINREEHLPMILREFPRWEERVIYWEIPEQNAICPAEDLPLIEKEVESLLGSLLDGHALGQVEDVLAEF